MKCRYKTMDEIKDSRLLFDRKLPPFGFLIIIMVTLLMGFLIYMSITTNKVSIIKSNGVVESNEKNFVMAPYAGEVVTFELKEGDIVKEGDVLFSIKSSDIDLQIEQLNSQKLVYQKDVEQYNKLIDCIKNNNNSFSATIEEEKLYFNKYEAYKSKVDQLKVDSDTLRGYGYTEEQINDLIKTNETNANQIYYEEMQAIETSIAQLNSQISSIDVQLETFALGKEEYNVKATASGKIHIIEQYNTGMLIQAGTTVASIASDSDDMKIKVSISEADAIKVKEGQKVDIAVNGLSNTMYSTISGEVISKDTDVTIGKSNEGTISYFNLIIEPDKNYVVGKNGEKVLITNGLSVETRIKYDKETYFHYVLGALGLCQD